jgi:hypothetical protein
MTKRPPYPATGEDSATAVESTIESTTGAPRWVKVFGIIVLGLAVLFVGLKLTGIGPSHGPGRHGGSGTKPPAGVTETGGQTSPSGMNHG